MTASELRLQRCIIFTTSLIVIGVELALMRELALRFWEHLGWLVISVALLGFGASGTVLVLVHRFCTIRRRNLQFSALLGLALSLPSSLRLADLIELDLVHMIWQPAMAWQIGALELVLGTPFVFAGMYIGLALEDSAERVPGNYGASFLGSGAGGLAAILLLHIITPRQLIFAGGCTILAMAFFHAVTLASRLSWLLASLIMVAVVTSTPSLPKISADKDLPQILAMEESTILASEATPQGLITLVDAPSLHLAPGLALTAPVKVPPQYPLLIDGQLAGSLYLVDKREDFSFLDYTTMALPYHLSAADKVLLANDPGSDLTGLAVYHHAGEISVLSASADLNRRKMSAINGYGGFPYTAPNVLALTATLRGFLQTEKKNYSLIVLPTVGTDPGGLSATQPESTFTRETLALCLDSLADDGLLSVTTLAHSPPRESLRLLNMLIDAIRKGGGDPSTQIVVIRSWSTVTLVAARKPLTAGQHEKIRKFCTTRAFDLVWLTGVQPYEVNIHHQLETPGYYQGAARLMGPERDAFIRSYLYDLSLADDDRPFFNRFGRWRGWQSLTEQMGKRGRTYAELGSFLLVAALVQAVLIAFFLIPAPLAPVIGLPGRGREQLVVLLFFTAIGLGFMFLEMGLLQRLTVYLAHPLWAAATVLSGVLFFAGLGSVMCGGIKRRLRTRHLQASGALVLTGIALLLVIDPLLAATEKYSTPMRVVTAVTLIGPLATLMGMVFPTGIKRLAGNRPRLIPWAWAVNGFASVLAALLTPLLAMQWGFLPVAAGGLCCYAIAAFSSLGLPSAD